MTEEPVEETTGNNDSGAEPASEETRTIPKPTLVQGVLFFCGLLFFVALRWNSFSAPFDRDEGEYAYSAWSMGQGRMPYENSFLQKPPLIVYTYLLAQAISADSVVTPRILATLSLLLTIAVTGLIVSRGYGWRAGVSTVWISAAMFTLKVLTPYAANTEMFMLLPLVVLVLLYSWNRGHSTGTTWFFAGGCAAASLLFKPIALVVVLFIFALWAFETWKETHDTTTPLRRLTLALLGGTLTSLLALAPFIAHDGAKSFYECAVAYNYFYAQDNSFGFAPFISFVGDFFGGWWILFLLPVGLIVTRPKRWAYYAALWAIALLSIYRATSGHYYLLTIPFWAIVASISLHGILETSNHLVEKVPGGVRWGILTTLVVITLLPPIGQLTSTPDGLSSQVYAQANPFIEARLAADIISKATNENDPVFVAGSEPEINFYAKRRNPSRFVIMYPMMLNTPLSMTYQQETIAALQNKPPKIIVLATSRLSWLEQEETPKLLKSFLMQFLRSDYQIRGGVTREGKAWQPITTEESFNNCSLLLYERRP